MTDMENFLGYDRVSVIAGPLGFYGNAYRLAIGPCRPDKDQAWLDAEPAAELIDAGGVSAIPQAWRAMFVEGAKHD